MLLPLTAAAQESGARSLVLLAPDEVRAEWTAALQLELAARGALAIPAEVPEAATALIGDAEAQRAALTRGAAMAIGVQPREDGWILRMIAADGERARVISVAHDADARTVALILVSILDGARPAEPAIPVETIEAPAPVVLDESASSAARTELGAPASDDEEVEDPAEPPRRRGEPYVHWSGLLGVSGLGLMNPERVQLGLTLRAGIAMRYGVFEAALLHDLGLYFEQPVIAGSVQPLGRLCAEVGGATTRTDVAFHAGIRGCFGSVFATEAQPGFISVVPRTHLSGGAYAALSFALTSWIRLFVRADLDLGWTDMFFVDEIDAIPAISSFLSFE